MTPVRARIVWLDVARTIALLCMAIFHFCFDLAMFGLIPAETVTAGPLRTFAICIAASFIALAGVSLQVAHGDGIRWNGFVRRLVLLVTAAAVISVLTYIWVPNSYIFFGILHAIALFSAFGLVFLRVPSVMTAALTVGVIALPFFWAHPVFDARWLLWTGLGLTVPATMDYEPLFPWFGAFLAGMTAAKLMAGTSLLVARQTSRLGRVLSWPGQHSLWVYLGHQPVLIALLWVGLQFT